MASSLHHGALLHAFSHPDWRWGARMYSRQKTVAWSDQLIPGLAISRKFSLCCWLQSRLVKKQTITDCQKQCCEAVHCKHHIQNEMLPRLATTVVATGSLSAGRSAGIISLVASKTDAGQAGMCKQMLQQKSTCPWQLSPQNTPAVLI